MPPSTRTQTKPEPEVTKRRVTMTSVTATVEPDPDRPGETQIVTRRMQATDFVRPDILDAYVADARTRWQVVEVSDEPDAGPAGYHGATHVPPQLNHPLAGQTFPETPAKER
jgi:hypothetical protein